jgi:transcriptional regulator with XRE-family HTH domain
MSKSRFNGKRLKAIREKNAWSVKDFLDALDKHMPNKNSVIDERYLSRWENEGRTPRDKDIIQCMAMILGCETEDFFDPIDESKFCNAIYENIIDFSEIIKDRTEMFVGRNVIFKEVEGFLENNNCGYFLIKGDPGIGKSAIAASMVKKYNCAHHFNIRSLGIDRTDQFIKNICSQLITRNKLSYDTLPVDFAQDGTFLSRVLSKAVKAAKEKVIIVIDALDEINMDTVKSGHNPLYLPVTLPENIFIIATTRNEDLPIRFEYKCLQIPHDKWNMDDIEEYLRLKIDDSIRKYIKKQKIKENVFIKKMKDKSEGNFMYLKYVLKEIVSGFYKDMNFDELPVGLENYYEDHWRKMKMTKPPLPVKTLRIIYALSEAGVAISSALLSKFSKENIITVQQVIDEWKQFLHTAKFDNTSHYSFYHESFRDFLNRKDIIQAAGIDLKEINKDISDTFFND